MRTLMAVAAILVLAVAGVGGYVMLTDDGQDPGDGGAGETGPQYTDADMRWNYSLEEVPTNDETAWRVHLAIFCPDDKVGMPLKFIHRQDGYGLLLSQGVSSGTTYHSLILPQADTVLEFILTDGAAEYPLDPTLRMDLRWNAVLEEVPTNEGHSTLIHPTIHCPPGMEGQMVRLTVEGRGDGGVQYILLPGTNTYRPGAYLNTVELSEVRISLNGQPLPLDPTLQATVQ